MASQKVKTMACLEENADITINISRKKVRSEMFIVLKTIENRIKRKRKTLNFISEKMDQSNMHVFDQRTKYYKLY